MAEIAEEETVDKMTLYRIQLQAVLNADTKDYTNLHVAVTKRRYRKIQNLLNEGADVEAHNSYGLTPVHLAASQSDAKSMELLLSHGAQAKPECCAKFPPLMFAVAAKSRPLIQMLIRHGCNINELVDQSFGYLHYWVRHNDIEMVKFLLDNGADIDNLDSDNASPLCIAIRHKYGKLIELFLERGASVNDKAKMCHSALLEALLLRDEVIFQQLLPHARNFNDTDKNGDSILIIATKQCQYNIMRQLLEEGANPDVTCNLYMTPLHYAVRKNDCKAVELLCEFQASVYSVRTPTYLASKIINLLRLDNITRANIDCEYDNFSALDFATLYDHDCLELLLSSIHGCERRLVSENFLKPYFCMNRNCLKYYLKRKYAGMSTYHRADALAEKMMKNSGFEDICRKELEQLKATYLIPNVSYYDFMLSTRSKLVVYAKHRDVIDTFSQDGYMEEFPVYKHLLKWAFICSRRYIKIWERSLEVVTTLFKYQLPALVIENILDFLNDRDINLLEIALDMRRR